MLQYLNVLLIAMLPAVGNFGGGLLAEKMRVSEKNLSLALHGAAGVVLAVVGVELMPQALLADPPWLIALALVGGGAFFVLVDQTVELIDARVHADGAERRRAPWMIFFGVAVDLFSDGLMIGTGSTLDLSLALLLALGQVPADIPEGFATIATFRRQGVSRGRRVLLSAAFAIPVLLGATLGYWLLRGQSEATKLIVLAFTAGILVTVTIEEIMPEAHQEEDARLASLVFITGFALFTLLSLYFE